VTPPVAVAAYVAAGVAQADPMKVGFTAVRLGIAAYLVPFAFCYSTGLLLMGSPAQIAYSTLQTALGVAAAAMALAGFIFRPLNIAQRIVMGIAAVAFLWPNPLYDLLAAVLFAAIILWSWFQKRADR
jgi:TRAP-type uncharacterized transport system fused permease subunit